MPPATVVTATAATAAERTTMPPPTVPQQPLTPPLRRAPRPLPPHQRALPLLPQAAAAAATGSAVSLPASAAAVRRLSRAERGRRHYGSTADFLAAASAKRSVCSCIQGASKMVRQKRSKLEDCSQSLSESDDIHSESLPNNDDNYQCDSSDNSDSNHMDVPSQDHLNVISTNDLNDMDVSQPHVNEISTNELLKTLKRKLSKSKRSEDNIKMKRSESIELDNDVMINQVLRDIIQMDQIINNLKKKLNIHHNIGDQNLKDKNVDTDLKSDAFSRFSVKYFSKVLDSLSPHHKTVIENSCFRSMLLFDKCFVPNSFALWIAKQVDVNCSDIVLGQKLIPLNKQSVHVVLGLHVGGSTIHSKFDSGKQKILHIFGKTSIPSVKFFGEKLIKNEELPDDQILICFMIVSLNGFLGPNSSLIPSTKYLSAFEDMDLIESLDWCKLVFDWLMEHISKLEKSKTFGGCLFHLAVNYLDFLNFGSQKVLLDTPIIKVWKRSMIKDYSKFDKISEGVYGKRPVNDIASTCYQMVNNSSSSFADMLKSSVGDLLPRNSKPVQDDDKLPIPNEEFNPVNKSTNLNSLEQDKMYMVTLENSTSPTASLNENKENEKGCHMIKDSPDVVFIGEKKFSKKCADIGNKTNMMYNKMNRILLDSQK
ncbi:hypothetical protein OsI_21310 [Oryza sativa Indica Group]|uniref:Uncharacterized protein n=1 Tax=Oryza sativa subsp. indica TaxID=39946 RepID=B8B1I4_ORYSI|nr:hypothetical protein OsI_21310 [Oryza sativa Indica Group]